MAESSVWHLWISPLESNRPRTRMAGLTLTSHKSFSDSMPERTDASVR